MTLTDLADRIGMTQANLSILKTGKARAICFSTLEMRSARRLSCQPGDLLRFEPTHGERERTGGERGMRARDDERSEAERA